MNETILKFNYPTSLIKKYNHWVVLLRPKQITLGSIVIAYIPDVESLSDVTKEGFNELQIVIKNLEDTLKKTFSYDKINYLMLMLVDKQVHMHVIPRYKTNKQFNGMKFLDIGWPGLPDMTFENILGDVELNSLKSFIHKNYIQ
jgi:diadenosine tetraphosphate (Ap4A) HIT family hydrolase